MRPVSAFLSSWLGWEKVVLRELKPSFQPFTSRVDRERFLQNVSDCDSTGAAHRGTCSLCMAGEIICLQGDMFHCALASRCFLLPYFSAHSLYHLSFWISLPTPWPTPPFTVQLCPSMSPSIFSATTRLPLLFAQSHSCCPGVAFLSHLSLVFSSSLSRIPSVFPSVIPVFWVPWS